MAPKTRNNKGRRGARPCVGSTVQIPLSARPSNAQPSLALVPYKVPPTSPAAPIPMNSPDVDEASAYLGESSVSPKERRTIGWKKVSAKKLPEVSKSPRPKRFTRSASRAPIPSSEGPSSHKSSPAVVPPPTKRQKDGDSQKDSPSSKQVHIYQTLNHVELMELVCVPQIIQERSFCIDELGGLFRQAVLRQGWDVCLERMASVRLNLTLVKEFYASLAASFGPSRKAETLDSKPVTIRGKKVLLSPISIGCALGLPVATKVDKERVDSDLKLMTKEHVVECCYIHPPSRTPAELSCGQLHVSHRAIGHLVRALLYPTTQTSQLPLAEAKLVCYIATENKRLPAEFFLFQSLRKIAIAIARGKIGPKSSLFHPGVISIFCLQQGIDFCEGDELGEPIKLSMSSVIRGNAQSLTPGLSLDVEAAISMARKNAVSFEERTDQRLSAIEKMLGKLHDAFVAANMVPPTEHQDDEDGA